MDQGVKTVDKSCERHPIGSYLARPVDWGISKTKAGLPQVTVCFRYKGADGQDRDILWFGSFKDTVVERTVDTLMAMGLKGSLETLADGVPGAALNSGSEMEIVIEHRVDQNGVKRAGVAWVNDPAKSRIEKISKAEAGSLLSGVNAILMRKRQNDSAASAPDPASEPDLPF